MSVMRWSWSAALVVVAALALPVGTASADTTLATGLPGTVKVSMRGSTVAWSAPAAGGRWRLVLWRNGVVTRPAVAAGRVPFDVDLGDDGHGRLVATYSRCTRAPAGLGRPRGCDVYRYDVTAGRERRVRGLGVGRASDYLPTATRGRIGFARSIAGGPARLYVRRLDGGRVRALPGGLRNRDPRTGPRSLDLGPRGLAIAWVARGPAGGDFPYGAQEARFDVLGGRGLLLARYVQGDVSGTDVVGISATDDGGVLWGAQGNGEDGRSRLYLVPRLYESSDSRYLGFRLGSAAGSSLDRAAVLACGDPPSEATDCSVVLLSG